MTTRCVNTSALQCIWLSKSQKPLWTIFMNPLATEGCIYSCTSNSYIYFSYIQETNCGVEQMLRNCAYVVSFCFHLACFHIALYTVLDAGLSAVSWSGNVSERMIGTLFFWNSNKIKWNHGIACFPSCSQKKAFVHFPLLQPVSQIMSNYSSTNKADHSHWIMSPYIDKAHS